MPAATAAADPPEEPPGVRSGFHGLRVCRLSRLTKRERHQETTGHCSAQKQARVLVELCFEIGSAFHPIFNFLEVTAKLFPLRINVMFYLICFFIHVTFSRKL